MKDKFGFSGKIIYNEINLIYGSTNFDGNLFHRFANGSNYAHTVGWVEGSMMDFRHGNYSLEKLIALNPSLWEPLANDGLEAIFF